MKKKGIISILLLVLMAVWVLPLFAAEQPLQTVPQKTAGIKGILQPTTTSLTQVSAYLPKLVVLLLILVIGALVAVGIAALVRFILEAVKLEKGLKKIKVPDILKKGGIELSFSDLITEIIFFILIIATLITALEYYGVGTAGLSSQILAYIPQVVAAIFILILGILVAIFIAGVIKLAGGNMKIAQSDTLGNIAKYAVIVVSSLLALRELGIAVLLTDRSKDIVFAGIILALALGFGLGAKEKAGKFLDGVFKK